MSTHMTGASFAPGAQDQPAGQADRGAAGSRTTTRPQAERHEALWLSLAALHKDTVALGAKKPGSAVSEPVRIVAEALLSDCAPFIRRRGDRLAAAAPDLGGLAVQLGQALAGLESWESLHTSWDDRFKCRIWRLDSGYLPIMRLKPPAAALKAQRTDYEDIRNKLVLRLRQRERGAYQEGFEAGRASRAGLPEAGAEAEEASQTYPRLRQLD